MKEQDPVIQVSLKRRFVFSVFLSIILLLVLVVGAFASDNFLWQDQFGELIQYESASGVATLGDQVFVSGWLDNENYEYYWIIRAYNGSTGNIIWEDQYLANSEPERGAIAADDNRLFVGGSHVVSNQYNWLIRAYDTQNGSLLWQDDYDLANGNDVASAVLIENDQLFVAGSGNNGAEGSDWVIRSYNPTDGTLLWQDQYGIAGARLYISQIAVQGNQLFVAGNVSYSFSSQDWLIRVYDTDTGFMLWQNQFDLAGSYDSISSIAVANNLVIIAGGGRNENGDSDWLVRAYDRSNGSLQWHDQLDVAGDSDGATAITTQGRAVLVAGSGDTVPGAFSGSDAIIRIYDMADGALLWEDYSDYAGSYDTYRHIAVHKGQIIVAGPTGDSFGRVGWMVRVINARSKMLLWQDYYSDGETINDMAINDNQAFIVGEATGLYDIADWMVRAYRLGR